MNLNVEFLEKKSNLYIYFGISILIVGLATFAYSFDNEFYQSIIGDFNPIVTMATATIIGGMIIWKLDNEDWFYIHNPKGSKWLLDAVGLPWLIIIPFIIIDVVFILPKDINVLPPEGVLYYPVMGFLAEIIFHVLPIGILAAIFTMVLNGRYKEYLIVGIGIAVSLIEPIFQVLYSTGDEYNVWSTSLIGIHIFLFNLAQIVLYRRYGFVAMLTFRYMYYFLWHGIWAIWRLDILF